MSKVERAFEIARETYADTGVDVENAMKQLASFNLSIHCWQGDDVRGFEQRSYPLSGGIMTTGNYLGRARNQNELWMDLEKTLSLIPGKHRVNLHASYGMFDKSVERNEILPEHYVSWVDWARENDVNLDFNATLFSHPRAESGFTLSSKNIEVRKFWVEHVKRSREVAAYIGSKQESPCIHNLWIPDGMKDQTIDKAAYRNNLKDSLDDIYSKKYDKSLIKDSLEPKLFGNGI